MRLTAFQLQTIGGAMVIVSVASAMALLWHDTRRNTDIPRGNRTIQIPVATPSPVPVPSATPLPAKTPAPKPPADPPPAPAPTAQDASALVTAVNAQRSQGGIQALTVNAKLTAAALAHARDMAARNYFDHTSPEGGTMVTRVNAAGYAFSALAENLGLASEPGEIVPNWMNSPPHRANILNGEYREVGIGTATGTWQGMSVVYAVAVFGSP